MLTDPRAKYFLVTSCVYCCDDHISFNNLAWLYFNVGDFFLPKVPLLVIKSDFVVKEWILGSGRHWDRSQLTNFV